MIDTATEVELGEPTEPAKPEDETGQGGDAATPRTMPDLPFGF